MNWLESLSQEKQFLFVVRRKSCSEAGRRHLWRFVSVEKFLYAVRQVGRTWRGQLMTGIWRNFWLSKQTCLSFVPSATQALLGLCQWLYCGQPNIVHLVAVKNQDVLNDDAPHFKLARSVLKIASFEFANLQYNSTFMSLKITRLTLNAKCDSYNAVFTPVIDLW